MYWRLFFAFALALAASSCSSVPPRPVGAAVAIDPPLGLPPVPIPRNNPPTADAIALGRRIFYDVRLSADDTVSCATCHNPRLSFTDGMPHSVGVKGQRGQRNAPTVLNSAYDQALFWDGRAASLEQQVGGPMENPVEMGQPHGVAVAKLEKIPEYQQGFARVFGKGPVTLAKIEMVVASFERTALSGNSPFDRYLYRDDKTAMNEPAIRGLAIFTDKKRGNCSTCHLVGETYSLFTDGKYHNLGVGMDPNGQLTDLGRYTQTKVDADKGAFKTPSLRDVALTAPYMHDGSLKTLKDVVEFYKGGGNSNPHLDPEIKELKLSAQDKADLVQFLESLTGAPPADAGPPAKNGG